MARTWCIDIETGVPPYWIDKTADTFECTPELNEGLPRPLFLQSEENRREFATFLSSCYVYIAVSVADVAHTLNTSI